MLTCSLWRDRKVSVMMLLKIHPKVKEYKDLEKLSDSDYKKLLEFEI
jgi:hypothetical protein